MSVRIPAQKHEQLVKLAGKWGVSLAIIVRWAIAAYLEDQEATDGELSLAAELTRQDSEVVPIESGPRRKRNRLYKAEGDA